MFLNYLKLFFVKSKIKSSLNYTQSSANGASIQKVGLLVDESNFFKKDFLIKELLNDGILENNLEIIVYRDKVKKGEECLYTTFSSKDLNWNGTISNSKIIDFVNIKFDLLISFYDIEKAILLLITHDSKAKFKVGFSAIDNKLNHLIINDKTENHSVFTKELFRYLKILKKI